MRRTWTPHHSLARQTSRSHWHLPILCTGGQYHHDHGAQIHRNSTSESYREPNAKRQTVTRLRRHTSRRDCLIPCQQHGTRWPQQCLLNIRIKSKKQSRRPVLMSNDAADSPNNSAVITIYQIIKDVMSSTAKAELLALFINCQKPS